MREFHGNELRRLIKKNINGSKKKYISRKNKLRETVGFDGKTGEIHVKGILPEKYQGDADSLIIDLFLGEKDKVSIKKNGSYRREVWQ